jgi:hypothetical protein
MTALAVSIALDTDLLPITDDEGQFRPALAESVQNLQKLPIHEQVRSKVLPELFPVPRMDDGGKKKFTPSQTADFKHSNNGSLSKLRSYVEKCLVEPGTDGYILDSELSEMKELQNQIMAKMESEFECRIIFLDFFWATVREVTRFVPLVQLIFERIGGADGRKLDNHPLLYAAKARTDLLD